MTIQHFSDEEPEVEETWDYDREQAAARGHCERCGIEGHHGKDCPTITPLLFKADK